MPPVAHKRTASEIVVDIFMSVSEAEGDELIGTAKAIMKQRFSVKAAPRKRKATPKAPAEVPPQAA